MDGFISNFANSSVDLGGNTPASRFLKLKWSNNHFAESMRPLAFKSFDCINQICRFAFFNEVEYKCIFPVSIFITKYLPLLFWTLCNGIFQAISS
jgi:hypothetical protein